MTSFSSENQLQKKLVRLIKNDELGDAVEGAEGIRDLLERQKSSEAFPTFSIDHLVRISCAEAASHALSCLHNLEILTDDLNVSLTTGQQLRPDIVCFAPEGESLVLFELKKSDQTGRQALTELIAYEQELKNHLPFLANYETIFVLVSSEWSTLMDHSAASAVTWSGRQLLCLEARLAEKGRLKLKPRLPPAWHITGSAQFPSFSLPCVTWCLYDYKTSDARRKLDHRLITTMNLIAREGDRIGAHGFAMLWQDHVFGGYNITICGISPFSFYRHMRQRGIVLEDQSHLVAPLDQALKDWDPQGHAKSIFQVAKAAEAIVSEIAAPAFEGLSDWQTDRIGLSMRAEPIYCEFWGLPGNFVRFFTAHPAVRKHRTSLLNGGQSDWQDPRIGIALLESFLVQEAFQDGNVRCSDCFKLGVAIGLDFVLRRNLKVERASNSSLYCRHIWNVYRLAVLLEEVQLLAGAAKNVDGPKTPYVISNNFKKNIDKNNLAFVAWIKNEFLQKSVAHGLFLDIGIQGAFFFDKAIQKTLPSSARDGIVESLADHFRLALSIVFSLLAQLKLERGLLSEHKAAQRLLLKALNITKVPKKTDIRDVVDQIPVVIIAQAWDCILPIANMLIDAVYHDHAEVAQIKPDWEWLHQGIREMYARGEKYPAVHLLANGTVVTGLIEQPGINWLVPIGDVEKEVVFCDHSKGILIVMNTTWEELKSGKHFPVIT
ncbi:hypothetical protein IVB25_25285 [Bradyrhizobium sp. 193]|uniref:hypothetical protein n=1 Tax=Bradyrhizobium sp. 193 TaxID=2782661 RepID=UPI001FF9D346|nr:hypothetical protein [Bradyrhizobium sp. 193]MCK1485916.1 hypothetical protein [Bradyrhizobium sp. 193]